ncbi:hypothetical protein [Piscinibacterium candidicorallinum]|uniref:Uncharacterized protein n=1 Tax=Piscinibacterium candidicorallinum TaxID=1793872 RepID=A0ABV7GY30_9BURK
MNQQLVGISLSLTRMMEKIRAQKLAMVGSGKAIGPLALSDETHHEFFTTMEKISEQLGIAMKALGRMESPLMQRARRIHDVPREGRFSEKQSINAQLANIQKVRNQTAAVARALMALYGDSITPTSANLIEGMEKAIGEFNNVFGKMSLSRTELTTSVQKLDGPVLSAQPANGLTVADALSQLFLLYAMIVSLIELRGRKGDK